jgi:hypothetical protein
MAIKAMHFANAKYRSLTLVVILIFFALRVPHLHREYTLEEPHIVKSAEAIMRTGYPLIYFGEQDGKIINLWKPPGFVFLLALYYKIFGVSETASRLLPLSFSFGQLILILLAPLLFWKDHRLNERIALLAGLLFAIHPYAILNSIQIDLDGGVLAFFITLFLFLVFRILTSSRQNSWEKPALVCVFFLAFATKFEPSLMAAVIAMVATYRFRKSLLQHIFGHLVIAIMTFFALFLLYNQSFGHPEATLLPLSVIGKITTQTLAPRLDSLGNVTDLIRWRGSIILLLRFTSWLTIPTILLAFYCLIRFLINKETKQDRAIPFLLMWISVFVGIYLLFGWSGDYPRYFAPIIPPLFLLIGFVIAEKFKSFKPATLSSLTLPTLSITLLLIILAERLNTLFLDRITGWIPSLAIPFLSLLTISSLMILLLARKKQASPIVLLILLSLNFVQSGIQDYHDLTTSYSLTNFYGARGFKEAGTFLRQHVRTKPNTVILTVNPVAYYWGGKYFEYADLLHFPEKRSSIQESLADGRLSAVALPKVYLEQISVISPVFPGYLSQTYARHLNFGGEKGIEVYY